MEFITNVEIKYTTTKIKFRVSLNLSLASIAPQVNTPCLYRFDKI